MNKTIKTAVVTAAFVCGLGLAPKAEAKTILGDFLTEKNIDVGIAASLDYYSKYVWRGMLLDDDNVLQPGVEVSVGSLTAGFWGSWDVESEDSRSSDETDGYLDYGFDLGMLSEDLKFISMNIGHTWYAFPESDLHAQEYYIGMSFDTFLAPSITYYHDYSEQSTGGAHGDYVIGSIGHSFTLNEEYGLSLDLGEEAGYNHEYFINGNGGYSLSSVGLSLPLKDSLDLSVTAAYNIPFGDLKDSSDGNYDNEFYYGAGLAMSF